MFIIIGTIISIMVIIIMSVKVMKILISVLSVKVGAQVMLLKNLSVSVKLVNGSRYAPSLLIPSNCFAVTLKYHCCLK